MTESIFNEQVKRQFRYLIVDYGFSVVGERYDPETFGNSLVDFLSGSIVMRVLLDRGQVMVDFRLRADPSESWYDLYSVIEFLAPEADEPAYIFPETWDNYQDMVNWQIDRLAGIVRQYCVQILRGEFSRWEELAKTRSRRAIDGYRMLTGKSPQNIASKELGEAIRREEEQRAIKSTASSKGKKPV